MFYCEECRIENQWPESISKSQGRCEICEVHTECHDRPSSSLPKTKFYYIQNDGYLGNALMWWKQGGGYTCDINQAERFPEKTLKGIHKRQQDTYWPCDYIDNLKAAQQLIIDSQYIDHSKKAEL